MDCSPVLDLAHLGDWLLAQTPSPSPIAPDVQVLMQQLEFLKDANDRLSNSFTMFLGFLAIVGAYVTFLIGKNLDDAKKVAREMVREELATRIKIETKAEIAALQRSLISERAVSDTVIDYYIPSNARDTTERKLLLARGFQDVRLWNQSRKPNRTIGRLLVLDLVNSTVFNVPPPADQTMAAQKNQIVAGYLQEVAALKRDQLFLVIYVRPGRERLEVIDTLSDDYPNIKFYTTANLPIALIGAVVDAAYVAYVAPDGNVM